MKRVLIVDDNEDISELISLILRKEDIDSKVINNPMEVIDIIEKEKFDLILLDIMMPEMSGVELCSKIRDKVSIPIIFLTAKNDIVDKMLGYEIGGDDYITKPFDNRELVLKIKSHLRLNQRIRQSNNNKHILTNGDLVLNKDSYEVTKNGKKIILTTREFELLKYFMENVGIALSKEQIFESVWGSDYGDIGTVAVNIKNLRDKLDDNDEYIMTIWGYGYKFIRHDNE